MGEAREPPLGDRGSSGSVDRDSCNMAELNIDFSR